MAERSMKIEKIYEPGAPPRWRVTKPGRVPRGDILEWTLYPDPENQKNAVQAYFQFGHSDLVKNMGNDQSLTRDLTAKIEKPHGKLRLKLSADACRRCNPRRYAVWVKDDTLADGGEYAVGEDMNPPPEIEVGGG